MARVIQGIPALWDPSIANRRFPSRICAVAWSPCSRLIATACDESSEVVVLDAVTLEQLHTMHYPQGNTGWAHITFSPGSHLLTAYSWELDCLISWDLQTGGLLNKISTWGHSRCNSVSYSKCETMVGGLFKNSTIIIYNVLSGIPISSHSIQQSIVETIWTHGEYLQFATVESGSITTWKVSFTSSHAPTKVDSMSIPGNFSGEFVLLPTLHQLAFIHNSKVLIWDGQKKKVLLDSADVRHPRAMSFSPGGHFFICGSQGKGLHIWKESPTGYLFHQKLVSGANGTTPLISPNGELVISSSNKTLQLWHTENSSTSFSSISMQAPCYSGWFFIEFSPDESLVAVTERLSRRVTVLDIKSGNPWLVIDTGTKACGLKITEGKIIVVGDGKIITWDLPARGCGFNIRRNINNSIQTTTFTHSVPIEKLCASISPNLDYVAFGNKKVYSEALCVYNRHTGEKLAVARSGDSTPGFSPSGNKVWCAGDNGKVDQWEIIGETGTKTIKLKKLEKRTEPLSGFPWHSPHGYQVTYDGWILSPNGKHLLWLPQHWQQDAKIQRKWSGKFLAVWNKNSTEPCILKLEV